MPGERHVPRLTQVLRCCDSCGQPIDDEEELLELGGMQIAANAIIYEDRVSRATRGAIVLLRMLVLRRRVSKEAFLIATNSECEVSTAASYACLLRRALRSVGAPFEITTVRGWGYELCPRAEAQSRAIRRPLS